MQRTFSARLSRDLAPRASRSSLRVRPLAPAAASESAEYMDRGEKTRLPADLLSPPAGAGQLSLPFAAAEDKFLIRL